MSTPQARFGRLPSWVATSGRIAQMKPADTAVLLVLVAHMDSQYRAFPSLETLARLSGLTVQAVCVAIARLEGLGVLWREPGGGVADGDGGRSRGRGGRGASTMYRLVEQPVGETVTSVNTQPGLTVSDSVNTQPGLTVSGCCEATKTLNAGAETLNAGARNTQPGRAKHSTPVERNRVEQSSLNREERTERAAAAFSADPEGLSDEDWQRLRDRVAMDPANAANARQWGTARRGMDASLEAAILRKHRQLLAALDRRRRQASRECPEPEGQRARFL